MNNNVDYVVIAMAPTLVGARNELDICNCKESVTTF